MKIQLLLFPPLCLFFYIKECNKLGIRTITLLDTNCDPDLVDIPIPGNDDAVRSIKLILKSLTDHILLGQSKT